MSSQPQWEAWKDRAEVVRNYGVHAITRQLKGTGFWCCRRCGLVNMKNAASQKALRKDCTRTEDA